MKRKGKARKYRDYKQEAARADSKEFHIVKCPKCGAAVVAPSRGIIWNTQFDDEIKNYAASEFANSPRIGGKRYYCFDEYTKATAKVDNELIEYPEPHGHYVRVRQVSENKLPDGYESNRSSDSSGFLGIF